ncbi:LacI family transcriptional regulator [Aliiroseovarius halocynthiae]|uniref:LacI family transcriptional regulator n=1 Tax=Aliiroseovarius halocynthiae TaxID=985055 RepID=A0A545SQF6_9RHOB|nr:LacI family transcriptional regulator [Aliiroseovarius halocynthiae]
MEWRFCGVRVIVCWLVLSQTRAGVAVEARRWRKTNPLILVTADDVADLAGVSRWTVNRAFKKEASISDKARDKIMRAASLASDRSNLVALSVDDFANPHKLVMLERLTRILRRHGWDTLLVNTLNSEDVSAALLNASQRRLDVAVLIGSGCDDKALKTALGSRRLRKLIVFARMSENANTISIRCDDHLAMTEMTDHVIAKGYKRPLFVAGPQTRSAHLLRKEAFLERWHQVKGVEPAFISANSYDPEKAYALINEHFTKIGPDDRPDILVCENDAIAMGAYDALRHGLGLRVPEDVTLTGFDDTPQAASPQYQLTTYHQPISEMVEGLVQTLKGETKLRGLQKLSGQLVVRDSA